MPGRLVSILFSRWINIVNAKAIFKDPKGRWHAIQLEANEKSLMIITIYWITENSGKEIKTVKAQLDKVNNKTQTTNNYRKDMLKELTNFI